MIAQLKSLNCDKIGMDEALSLSAFAKGLRAEYETRSIPTPEWLDTSIRTLNKEIETRRRDALEMRLKEIRAQKTQLLTAQEKRDALAAEEKDLELLLATK